MVPVAALREGEMAVKRLGLRLLSGERKEEFGGHQRTAAPLLHRVEKTESPWGLGCLGFSMGQVSLDAHECQDFLADLYCQVQLWRPNSSWVSFPRVMATL